MISAQYSDKQLIIDILTESFDDNISVNYVVKRDNKRQYRIRQLMDYSFELCFKYGEVLLSENKDACALILYAEKQRANIRTFLLDLKLVVNSIGVFRLKKVLERNSKIKSYYPDKSYLYLWFIGVKKREQNKGIGQSILKEIILKSQQQNRPIYLETSMQKNVAFYEKHRFVVYKKLEEPHTLFLIKREV